MCANIYVCVPTGQSDSNLDLLPCIHEDKKPCPFECLATLSAIPFSGLLMLLREYLHMFISLRVFDRGEDVALYSPIRIFTFLNSFFIYFFIHSFIHSIPFFVRHLSSLPSCPKFFLLFSFSVFLFSCFFFSSISLYSFLLLRNIILFINKPATLHSSFHSSLIPLRPSPMHCKEYNNCLK